MPGCGETNPSGCACEDAHLPVRICQPIRGTPCAGDLVDGQVLEGILERISCRVNAHSAMFAEITRPDCTLADDLVRTRNLHPEVRNLFSGVYSTGIYEGDFLFDGDLTVDGKLTVTGLIDPTGLELTPQLVNPGLVPENTVWVDDSSFFRVNKQITEGEIQAEHAALGASPIRMAYDADIARVILGSGIVNPGGAGLGGVMVGRDLSVVPSDPAGDHPLVVGSGVSTTTNASSGLVCVAQNVAFGAGSRANAVVVANGGAISVCNDSVIVGRPDGTGARAVIIGRVAKGADDSVAIGRGAKAGGSSTAVGQGADADGRTYSVAIGRGAVCTANNQIMLGRSNEHVQVPGTGAATSKTTGALRVVGGLGVGGSIFTTDLTADQDVTVNRSLFVGDPTDYYVTEISAGGKVSTWTGVGSIRFAVWDIDGPKITLYRNLFLFSGTVSTSPTTGAAVIGFGSGGLGVAGAGHFGSTLPATSAQHGGAVSVQGGIRAGYGLSTSSGNPGLVITQGSTLGTLLLANSYAGIVSQHNKNDSTAINHHAGFIGRIGGAAGLSGAGKARLSGLYGFSYFDGFNESYHHLTGVTGYADSQADRPQDHNMTGVFAKVRSGNFRGNTGAARAVGFEADVTIENANGSNAQEAYGARVVSAYAITSDARVSALNCGGYFEAACNVTGVGSEVTVAIGVHGKASGAVTNWAGYFEGNTKVVGLLDVTGALRTTPVTLVDGASITPDFADGISFDVTLEGNRTLENPTNMAASQSGRIVIRQDAVGGRTLAFGTYWKFPGGTVPTLTATASAVDMLVYEVISATEIVAQLIADAQ